MSYDQPFFESDIDIDRELSTKQQTKQINFAFNLLTLAFIGCMATLLWLNSDSRNEWHQFQTPSGVVACYGTSGALNHYDLAGDCVQVTP